MNFADESWFRERGHIGARAANELARASIPSCELFITRVKKASGLSSSDRPLIAAMRR